MSESVIFHKKSGKPLEVSIIDISDWEGFEKIIKFVQKYFSAVILAQHDGPDARKWILESKGHKFELIHDDGYGNYFIAPTKESEVIVSEIGKDLETRLKKLKE